MYVKRKIKNRFDLVKPVYKIIALVGARQAGKTTFLKEQIRGLKAKYLLFDRLEVKDLFESDIITFEKQYLTEELTVFDEVHYCKDAGRSLKYFADTDHKIWLTSSSEVILGKEILSYLVGRVTILRLFPFCFSEFLEAKDQRAMINSIEKRRMWEHLTYGGYPKVVLEENVERKKVILRDLHETMLLKDVAQVFAIDDLKSLEKTGRYLANNVGGILSYESAAKVVGSTFPTIKKYLDALEKSYLIVLVSPYCNNKNKEISKQPKIYFVDTGMRNAITGVFSSEVDGKLFENYVFTELLKAGFNPKYWRTKAGAEVDFVVELEGKIIPIECKLHDDKMGRSLKSFIKTYEPKSAFVVNYEMNRKKKSVNGCNISFCSVRELIKKLEKLRQDQTIEKYKRG